MTAVAVVAADVRTISATSSQITTGTLGETVTAGDSVYLSTADNKYYQTDGNTVDPANASFDGFALQGGDLDETISIQTGGTIYLGVDVVTAMPYVVGGTAGTIEDCVAACVTGLNTFIVGYGNASEQLVIDTTETLLAIYP